MRFDNDFINPPNYLKFLQLDYTLNYIFLQLLLKNKKLSIFILKLSFLYKKVLLYGLFKFYKVHTYEFPMLLRLKNSWFADNPISHFLCHLKFV